MAKVVSFLGGLILGIGIVMIHANDTQTVQYPHTELIHLKD